MQVLVAVKWVPSPESVAFDPVLNRINRQGVPGIVNPLDRGALHAARSLADATGGRVTAVTMGPPEAAAALEAALDAGADAAIHLCDAAFAGSDTLATARALAQVFRATEAEVFLFGASTVDGGTAQTAAQVATIAGVACLTETWELHPQPRGLDAVRHREGQVERWSVPLPAVLSVSRPARGEAPARAAGERVGAVQRWDAERLGLYPRLIGIRGSATYVQKITAMPAQRPGRSMDVPAAARWVAAVALPAVPEASQQTPTDARPAANGTRGALWALAETDGGSVHPSTVEGLARLRSVAGPLDAEVIAVTVRLPAGGVAEQLAAAGADRVVAADAGSLRVEYAQEAARVLAAMVRAEQPSAVLGPWSAWGRACLAMAAARLEAGLTGDFIDLDVSPRPGNDSLLDLVWLKPAWSGSALARVVARTTPAFGTLRPHAGRAVLRPVPGPVPLRVVAVTPEPPTVALAERVEAAAGDGSLGAAETAECVLAVGAAVEPATLSAVERWAAERGWAVCGTPAAVLAGVLPAHRELSVAVRSLSPRVFVGVRLDAPADLLPVRGAGLLVVVDPPAGMAANEYDARLTGGLTELLTELAPLLPTRPVASLV